MDVVVVESPAKAKTINKYLGRGYTVLASYGHVRDLQSKDGSVAPNDDFKMEWEVDERGGKNIAAIAKALKGADHLYLATDPDREGEAISWHVQELLDQQKALKGVDVKRVVFHEVTKDAVLDALKHPRGLNKELIDAYLARRALDYLVGFTLSPVLWRKLPGSRSAGRVQSVALRLISEREAEIEVFKPQEYWSVFADFTTTGGAPVRARLTHLDGEKLDKFSLGNEAAAKAAVAAITANRFKVGSAERKTVRRHPYPPFTTSTLQQEAARKLGFSASRTMRTAQRLYEGVDLDGDTVGLITYMRTDSVNLSQESVGATRALIGKNFGDRYVPEKPNTYRSTAKNAQEAHEAIRPTDVARLPDSLARTLDEDGRRLYDLIWKRTVASAMESAILEQVAVDVANPDGKLVLRATGSIVKFDGFLRLYQESIDDPDDECAEHILPALDEGQDLNLGEVKPEQHFTKPPPRYSEASLVKRLEELGIGRPSTYASILGVLQDRKYVRLESRRFIPEDRGRIVTAFLTGYFNRYVQYNFPAELEDKLDDISNGQIDWREVLKDFWAGFSRAVDDTKDLTISNVIDALDRDLGSHFFPADGTGKDPRVCPVCGKGRLGLKLGRHGAFVGCSNYPECKYTRRFAVPNGDESAEMVGPRELGVDPKTGEKVTLRKGPFGYYVQLGEAKEKGEKPKRAGLLKSMDPATLELAPALALLALPREVGVHPTSQQPILAGVGRFGAYLKHGPAYVSLGPDEDVLSIGLNRAVTVIDEAPQRKGRGAKPLGSLGAPPEDGKVVEVYAGRYGPYVKHGKLNASLPRDSAPKGVTLEEAIQILAERAAKIGANPPKRAARSKAARSKKASKKPETAESGTVEEQIAKPKAKTRAKPAAKSKKAAKTRAEDGERPPRRARAG
jgi:DNA topoisomerase-1